MMLLEDLISDIEPDLGHPTMNIHTQARIVLGSFALSVVLCILWAIDGIWLSVQEPEQTLLFHLNRLAFGMVLGFWCGYGIAHLSFNFARMILRFHQRHPRWLPSFMVAKEDEDEEANGSCDSEKGDLAGADE